MQPIVHGLKVKYEGQVNFVKLDIADRNTLDLRKQFGVRGVPHFFLLDGKGKVLAQWVGINSSNVFRARIDKALLQATPVEP